VRAQGWALTAAEAMAQPGLLLVDLREPEERARHGEIPGALHLPYPELRESVAPGGVLQALAGAGRRLGFFCAFGERSAMAVQAAQDQGLAATCHLEGGIAAWKKAGGAVG